MAIVKHGASHFCRLYRGTSFINQGIYARTQFSPFGKYPVVELPVPLVHFVASGSRV